MSIVMYLQRLEIQGFKSFAQKTVFEFPEVSSLSKGAKSVTAVVGPNGSGKSNVADAIRWTLGEQSLKLIRCKKADDVIFGGSESKARQGFAEVSLFFNNEDRELPIDFGEVVLTRRVYRNGENEYLLNKSKVRLFDILLLLAKANFGQKTYSIIGQGMVDQIINISPFERKEFFDEATGVKQYQIKRDQAMNRLRHSSENLTQTNQILSELEPRLRSLERQVRKLEKKKQVETQLRDLQRTYYAGRWQEISIKKEKFNSEFEMKRGVYEALVGALNDVREKLQAFSRQDSRQEQFNNLQKEYNKITGERNEIFKDLAIVKGKLSLEYVKAGQQNLSWLSEKKDQLTGRLNEIKESLNNQLLRLENEQKSVDETETTLTRSQEEVARLNNELLEAEAGLQRLKNQQSPADSRRQVAQAMMRQAAYIKGIVGEVSRLYEAPENYQRAIASALDIYRDAIVVDDSETAVHCIEYLKRNKLGSLMFIPLNIIKAEKIIQKDYEILQETGATGFAVEQLKTADGNLKLFRHLLGKTVIIDNLNSAGNIIKYDVDAVTVDGDSVSRHGVMSGGFVEKRTATGANSNSSWEDLARAVEILKLKLNEAQTGRERLSMDVNDGKMNLQISDAKVKSLQADYQNLLKDREKIDTELESSKFGAGDQDKYFKQLQGRQKELERQTEALDEQMSVKRREIDRLNAEEEKKKKEIFRLQEELQKHQESVNAESNKVHEIKIELARLETHEEDMKNEIRQELGADFDLALLLDVSTVDMPINITMEIVRLKKDIEMIGGIEPEVADEHKSVAERYEFLSSQARDLEKGINDLEKMATELDKIISGQFDSSFKKINIAFSKYFIKIFGGGKAKLEVIQRETNQADNTAPVNSVEMQNLASPTEMDQPTPAATGLPAQAGIDIMVAPPNKKINHIAALSGGERTMTSLALICAIIDSNPAPFIVMDEVDAALDEANSEKFSVILRDLAQKSQFIVITHNQIVMHVADVL
ncbi:MAG: AAA family ATPase, partial [Parcubacteria group bacterium]